MATPPTFVSDNESAWNTDVSPKVTTSFNGLLGDIIAAVTAEANEDGTETIALSISSGETVTKTESSGTVDADGQAASGTATLTADRTGATFTSNITGTGVDFHGVNATVWRSSGGVGNVTTTSNLSGGPSWSFTTNFDNSAVLALFVDWNAIDGTTRTWRTVNGVTPTAGNSQELTYFRDSAQYTVYVAYWSDAGAAGAKTLGLSAPTGQDATAVAVEIRGTTSSTVAAGGWDTSPLAEMPFSEGLAPWEYRPDQPPIPLESWANINTTDAVVLPTAVATVTALPTLAVQTGSTVTPAAIDTVTTVGTAVIQTDQTVTPTAIATVTAIDAPVVVADNSFAGEIQFSPLGQQPFTVSGSAPWTQRDVQPPIPMSDWADPVAPPSGGTDATATPAAIVTVTDVPSGFAVQTDQTATPAAIATVTALPAPAIQTDQTVTATAIATVTSLPTPTVVADNSFAGDIQFSPLNQTPFATTAMAPWQQGILRPPIPLDSWANVNTTDAYVLPSAIATVTDLPATIVSTGSNATPTPAAIATVTALPAPTIQTGSTATPTAIATVTALPSPTVSGNATVAATAIATVTALPAPTVKTSSTVTATALATVTALPTPTVSGNIASGITGTAYPRSASGASGNVYPPSGTAPGNVYPHSAGGIIGQVG